MTESAIDIIEPGRAIIDAHHHVFARPNRLYLAEEYRADIAAGHRLVASVYMEAGAFPRTDGPEFLRPLGEVEFANGVAAMGAGGFFGEARVCAGIVGHADLRRGDDTARLLDHCIAAAPDRYRGVRQLALDHPSETAFRFMAHRPPSGLLADTAFRAGFRHLAPRGLSFDMGVYHVQFDDVADLADAFPETRIVLNHMGMVMGLDADAAGRTALRHDWAARLRILAQRPNILCKLGGLGMPVWGFGLEAAATKPGVEALVVLWAPYIEAAIAAFGPDRCMFESNFPIDAVGCDYVTLWNVFKRIAAPFSASEKHSLFYETAARTYRLSLPALTSQDHS